MKKISKEWWFLTAGVAALVLGLLLRYAAHLGGDNGDFAEGLCTGFSLALFVGGLGQVRRSARRLTTRDSGRDSNDA